MSAYFEIDKTQTEQMNHTIQSPMCECKDCQWYYQYMKQLPDSIRVYNTASERIKNLCALLWSDNHSYHDFIN